VSRGDVVHNEAASRFEMPVQGRICIAQYRLIDGVMWLTHTEVPPHLQGRGHAARVVKAVVVLRGEAKGKTSTDDIINWSREHMAAYKVPKLVQFVDALPKSGSGKVMWRLLQEQEAAAPKAAA
jgi:acyl-CoA synthetase (AMP-forming)/AMP-acid ligase II